MAVDISLQNFLPSFWEEGKGIMSWLSFLCHATTPAPPSADPQCNNQPIVFVFAIQRGNVANLQYATIDLLLLVFCHSRRGKGENDMVDCFYFLPVPQHQHLPSTHSATINLLLPFKGERGQACNAQQ